MADVFSSRKRSKIMAAIKGRNTRPEKQVRSIIHRMGFRFCLYRKDLPGSPDIVLPKFGKVIFVNGCFWHGHKRCRRGSLPQTNRKFWEKKINCNINRDIRSRRQLKSKGWQCLTIWQCEINNIDKLNNKLSHFLKKE